PLAPGRSEVVVIDGYGLHLGRVVSKVYDDLRYTWRKFFNDVRIERRPLFCRYSIVQDEVLVDEDGVLPKYRGHLRSHRGPLAWEEYRHVVLFPEPDVKLDQLLAGEERPHVGVQVGR